MTTKIVTLLTILALSVAGIFLFGPGVQKVKGPSDEKVVADYLAHQKKLTQENNQRSFTINVKRKALDLVTKINSTEVVGSHVIAEDRIVYTVLIGIAPSKKMGAAVAESKPIAERGYKQHRRVPTEDAAIAIVKTAELFKEQPIIYNGVDITYIETSKDFWKMDNLEPSSNPAITIRNKEEKEKQRKVLEQKEKEKQLKVKAWMASDKKTWYTDKELMKVANLTPWMGSKCHSIFHSVIDKTRICKEVTFYSVVLENTCKNMYTKKFEKDSIELYLKKRPSYYENELHPEEWVDYSNLIKFFESLIYSKKKKKESFSDLSKSLSDLKIELSVLKNGQCPDGSQWK